MAWKYPNNKDQIKKYRESISYLPFTLREDTHCSPFYNFEKKQTNIPNIKPLEFQADELFKKESYRLQLVAESNNIESSQLQSMLSGKSLSSDSEEELKSEELLEMREKAKEKGRRKAEIFQSFQFGLQLEDMFNNNLSSLAKNINENQRSPQKTDFNFNNIRSGLLDEIDKVKGMIDNHKNFDDGYKSGDNFINTDQGNEENQDKDKRNKKQLKISKQNKNKNASKDQKELLDLSIQGLSPTKIKDAKSELNNQIVNQKDEKSNLPNQQDEDNISSENLNDYLNHNIIQRGVNRKKGLRQIFILYKKFKGNFYSIQIEIFYIPIYLSITDNLELVQDFFLWKDYLSKWMKLRGKIIENIFTSNGFRIMNLNQIKPVENILIIQDQDCSLEFWHDFQIYHNISLTTNEQRYFADYLNNLQTREEIYKSLISPSLLQKILRTYAAEKTPNTSLINTSTTQKLNQSKGFLPQINQKMQLQQVQQDQINEGQLQNQNTSSKKQMNQSRMLSRNSQSTKELTQIQKEKIDLVDLYSQYQNIMISSLGKKIKEPNKVQSISQGAILRQFNGVKMKILQQSFPYLAKQKQIEERLKNSPYKFPIFQAQNNQDNLSNNADNAKI
ncbi:hypothetical protein TTHERM_00666670 (macronuclear) [Tetrahymena thermophila SB210]|uniref:Uncharacterized protein n=1 Tax=Tetrahymena thermophila (strain SB210) TaxID=312017 RepID=Q23TB5_TETTS|nr:hypothetical protein TTHERM_00666670 [Tetrahymena thermophila SB210]EAR99791.1 hypothetical protein TTHERM_00666670 [Tetrahymena thermophila SB210]|eukprot:XP_001020036.1 hypothetical protein TTHERM_00666670 [Tetrahymena thermophila SB210]